MTLSAEDIKSLIAEFHASDWQEMALTVGDLSLVISRSANSPWITGASNPSVAMAPAVLAPDAFAPAAAQAVAQVMPATVAPPPAVHADTGSTSTLTSGPASTVSVNSPTIGLFWRSPQPGAPPYVDVGRHVVAEDIVCVIEVMKLMHHMEAGVTGTVTAVIPQNGVMVEHGTVLVEIEPDA